MARPFKCRRISFMPGVTYFKPAGIPMRHLEEVRLTVEELEAIRLKDVCGMEQEDAGEKMNISRPTFQRILSAARKKIADALLNGKAIRIEGGNFEYLNKIAALPSEYNRYKGHQRGKTICQNITEPGRSAANN
ncbi:MAG: DUF134 domain-containing protein [Dehalococcoidales bacterium]|nr:DUF134 domain-containing protein [Dehalococcoidales bacterium]